MVANAKHFNEKGSAIYEDAERVRKTASNWMVKFNPAYRNPAYVAVATPIPGDNTNGTHHVSAPTPRPSHSVRHSTGGAERSSRSSMAPARRKSESAAPSAAASAAENSVPGDYAGKTFQQAQEQLMEELINYTEYVALFSNVLQHANALQGRPGNLHTVSESALPHAHRLLSGHSSSSVTPQRAEEGARPTWKESPNLDH
jgi:hypothetical protein